jgi:hypothetical protein
MDVAILAPNADVRIHKGRYNVSLYIPETSTLSEPDIDRILALSSWDLNPNENADGFEGGRSVLIKKEHPMKRGSIELSALQISGIGYKNLNFDTPRFQEDDEEFHHPSNENLMNRIKSTAMTTTTARGGKSINSQPKYRALGTYTNEELSSKIRNTINIFGIELDYIVTPTIEAFGFYDEDALRNERGEFGFVVSPVPSLTHKRVLHKIQDRFTTFLKTGPNFAQAMLVYLEIAQNHILPFIRGMRELHDVGRLAHLQTHIDNYYLVDGLPYLVDWGTTVKLGDNKEDNILNRVTDLVRPRRDFESILRAFTNKSVSQDQIFKQGILAFESHMEQYSGNLREEIIFMDLCIAYQELLGPNAREIHVVEQWVKDLGVEGFPRKSLFDYKQELVFDTSDTNPALKKAIKKGRILSDPGVTVKNKERTGRNDECPCGSGKKYKKCCLKRR